MYSSMTTICLLPGIAASLLPFHRDFRSSCAIFRRPPENCKKGARTGSPRSIPASPRPPVLLAGAHRKTAKKAPGRVLRIQPCEASVVDSGAHENRKKGARTGSPGSSLARLPLTIPAPAEKLQKRRPDGFSKIQPCEASVVDSGAHENRKKGARTGSPGSSLARLPSSFLHCQHPPRATV